jgi:hypothetical protein
LRIRRRFCGAAIHSATAISAIADVQLHADGRHGRGSNLHPHQQRAEQNGRQLFHNSGLNFVEMKLIANHFLLETKQVGTDTKTDTKRVKKSIDWLE